MKKFNKTIFNAEEELIEYIEANTKYDVLGVFKDYVNVIDRYGDDGEEMMLELDRELNGHIILL